MSQSHAISAVLDWARALREAPLPEVGLSPEGARAALDAALDEIASKAIGSLDDGRRPYPRVTVVVAGTVSTAALEWAAVLKVRGTPDLVIKHAAAAPGFVPLAAELSGGWLRATPDRDAIFDRDLVVAMGSDATIAAIRSALPPAAPFLGFGHRFSVGLATSEASLEAFAGDAALHDGRGCLSPVAVFTTLDPRKALEGLADVMADAERRLPRGVVDPAEAARIRHREALARVVGAVRRGEAWSIHQMPAERFAPEALPRSPLLIPVADPDEARAAILPWWGALSTVGTDTALDWGPGPRFCRPGEMQRPPLRRLHDGVDWIAATGMPHST
jgi:hypothetical protein